MGFVGPIEKETLGLRYIQLSQSKWILAKLPKSFVRKCRENMTALIILLKLVGSAISFAVACGGLWIVWMRIKSLTRNYLA